MVLRNTFITPSFLNSTSLIFALSFLKNLLLSPLAVYSWQTKSRFTRTHPRFLPNSNNIVALIDFSTLHTRRYSSSCHSRQFSCQQNENVKEKNSWKRKDYLYLYYYV